MKSLRILMLLLIVATFFWGLTNEKQRRADDLARLEQQRLLANQQPTVTASYPRMISLSKVLSIERILPN
jgi:nitrogen fixation-related uncharacterized protein